LTAEQIFVSFTVMYSFIYYSFVGEN